MPGDKKLSALERFGNLAAEFYNDEPELLDSHEEIEITRAALLKIASGGGKTLPEGHQSIFGSAGKTGYKQKDDRKLEKTAWAKPRGIEATSEDLGLEPHRFGNPAKPRPSNKLPKPHERPARPQPPKSKE